MTRAHWTDPSGRVRVVDVREIGTTKKTVAIEYWDNAARGERFVNGRKYSHGTRRRLIVYRSELREVAP